MDSKESVIQLRYITQYQVRGLFELGDYLASKHHLGHYMYNSTLAIL